MKLSVILPRYEIGLDSGALRTFAQAVKDLGYQYLVAFDSLCTDNPWHEPLVLYAHLSGWTHTLELTTGVIVAPSRQTLLLAKQAASVDVFSGGRLRLGLGVGWNKTEFQAMNADWEARRSQIEEQVEVLRALWTQPTVTFQGKWHHLSEVHMPPLPLQRPIPIWLGGWAEAVLLRVGVLSDGWIPVFVDRPMKRSQKHCTERWHACGSIPVLQGGREMQSGSMRSLRSVCCGKERRNGRPLPLPGALLGQHTSVLIPWGLLWPLLTHILTR
jgi:probable F420-dependent oxidoreductase